MVSSLLAGNADGPPFDRPARGWYWEVVGPRNVLRSRSLEGASIDVPEFRRPPREERPAPADGVGPRNEALHFRIQQGDGWTHPRHHRCVGSALGR